MTLILTRAPKDYMLQVTDRLVTRQRKAFDELANKNIVYCAGNALVAIGYTGLAFLGDVPADQWIVETLTGHIFDRARKPPAISFLKTRMLDLGRALTELKVALDKAPVAAKWRAEWIAKSFAVCVAGWQWHRTRFRPLIAWLDKPCESTAFELGYMERYWFCKRAPLETGPRRSFQFTVGAAPLENITRPGLQALIDQLRDRSPDDAESVLVEAVREVASRLPEVGPHCVSILLMPPSVGYARVRYLPLHGPASAVISTSHRGTFRLPVAFSPWIAGPAMIAAPSVLSGDSKLQLGPYTVILEAPTAPGLLQIMSGQTRPKAP